MQINEGERINLTEFCTTLVRELGLINSTRARCNSKKKKKKLKFKFQVFPARKLTLISKLAI